MGSLLDHYQMTEAASNKAHVDQAEFDKEKAVEEAASLERDIDTLANTFGKACTVVLLGPTLHVNHVEDEAKRELKIEVTYKTDADDRGFNYVVEVAEKPKSSFPAKKFYPFMIHWLKGAR